MLDTELTNAYFDFLKAGLAPQVMTQDEFESFVLGAALRHEVAYNNIHPLVVEAKDSATDREFGSLLQPTVVEWCRGTSACKSLQLNKFFKATGKRVFRSGLDLGCGIATQILFLESIGKVRSAFGFDIAEDAIREAKAISARLGLRTNFLTGEMSDLPYPSETFELLLCMNVLHWCADWEEDLREMARVLAEDGTLFLTFPNCPDNRCGSVEEIVQQLNACGVRVRLPEKDVPLYENVIIGEKINYSGTYA